MTSSPTNLEMLKTRLVLFQRKSLLLPICYLSFQVVIQAILQATTFADAAVDDISFVKGACVPGKGASSCDGTRTMIS